MGQDFERLQDVISFVNGLTSPQTQLFFTQKSNLGYTTFAPNVNNMIKSDILNLIIDDISKSKNLEIVKYSPLGCKDDTIEECLIEDIGQYHEVIDSFSTADIVDTTLDPDELTFYTLHIKDTNTEDNVYFFRRTTKFKRLYSKGFFASFEGNKLNRMDSKMFGIDGLVDVIGIKDKAFILNHVSLERIFMMNEHYSNAATEALNKLRIKNKILNFEQFEIDCLDDKRIQKTLTKMLNEADVFEHALEDFQAIEKL